MIGASLVARMVKNLPAMQETQGWEDLLEEGMAIHSSILVWSRSLVHGHRSLVDYSPWGCKEPDTTEWLMH